MVRYINRFWYIVPLLLLCLMGYSCGVYKKDMFVTGGREEMIRNAVIDFIHSERSLLSQGEVFYVFTEMKCPDSISVYVLKEVNKITLIVSVIDRSSLKIEQEETSFGERVITLDTVRNKPIIIVDFLKDGDKKSIWFDPDAVTISYRAFPDHYFEWKDKLFFWYDEKDNNLIEKKGDVINAMYRHHYVDTLVWCYWPETVLDDSPKAKQYLFCDENLTRFSKKTIHGGLR